MEIKVKKKYWYTPYKNLDDVEKVVVVKILDNGVIIKRKSGRTDLVQEERLVGEV